MKSATKLIGWEQMIDLGSFAQINVTSAFVSVLAPFLSGLPCIYTHGKHRMTSLPWWIKSLLYGYILWARCLLFVILLARDSDISKWFSQLHDNYDISIWYFVGIMEFIMSGVILAFCEASDHRKEHSEMKRRITGDVFTPSTSGGHISQKKKGKRSQ